MGFFSVVEVEGAVQLVDVDGNERGTAALPLRVDPTGTTTQPISAASLPLPAGAATEATIGGVKVGTDKIPSDPAREGGNLATLVAKDFATQTTLAALNAKIPASPATDRTIATGPFAVRLSDGAAFYTGAKAEQLPTALVSGRLDANLGAWLGSTAPSVGQKTMAASVPVVVASDQDPIRVGGRANTGAAPDGYPVLVSGSDGSLVRTIKTDAQGRLSVVQASAVATYKGFVDGQITKGSVTPSGVYKTTYTEQTSNAQRSLVSSSSNDTAAGTGARTVRVTYLTETGAGPYTEDVTLNGTTPVNMVATNVCFVERIEAVTVGSAHANAGAIELKAATSGGGATVWSIAAGDSRTFGARHYVPVGRVGRVTGVAYASKGVDSANFYLLGKAIAASAAEIQVSEVLRPVPGGSFLRTYGTPISLVGPARITAWVAPDVSQSRTYYAAFDYYDEDVA